MYIPPSSGPAVLRHPDTRQTRFERGAPGESRVCVHVWGCFCFICSFFEFCCCFCVSCFYSPNFRCFQSWFCGFCLTWRVISRHPLEWGMAGLIGGVPVRLRHVQGWCSPPECSARACSTHCIPLRIAAAIVGWEPCRLLLPACLWALPPQQKPESFRRSVRCTIEPSTPPRLELKKLHFKKKFLLCLRFFLHWDDMFWCLLCFFCWTSWLDKLGTKNGDLPVQHPGINGNILRIINTSEIPVYSLGRSGVSLLTLHTHISSCGFSPRSFNPSRSFHRSASDGAVVHLSCYCVPVAEHRKRHTYYGTNST